MELSEREETNYFRALFDHCAIKDQSGVPQSVTKDSLVGLMKASGVGPKTLGKIYTKANLHTLLLVPMNLFLQVLREVTLAHNGVDLDEGSFRDRSSSLGKRKQIIFQDLPVLPQQFQQTTGRTELGAQGQPPLTPRISNEEAAAYLQVIKTKKPGKEPPYQVEFKEARTFFSDNGIQMAALRQIWNLCDQKGKGHLEEPEIILSLYLIDQSKKDDNIPGELPPSLNTFVEGYSRSSNSTANNSFSEIDKGPINQNGSMIRSNESKVNPKPVSAQATSLFGLADSNKPSPAPSPVQTDKQTSQRTVSYQNPSPNPPVQTSVSQRSVPTQSNGVIGESDPSKVNFNIFGGFSTPEMSMSNFGFNNVTIQSNPQPPQPTSEPVGKKDAFGFQQAPPKNSAPAPIESKPAQAQPQTAHNQPHTHSIQSRTEDPKQKIDPQPVSTPPPPATQETPKPKPPVYKPTFDEAKDLVKLTQSLELLTKADVAGSEKSNHRIAHLETQNFQTREKITDLVKQLNRETEKSRQMLESLQHRLSAKDTTIQHSQLALIKAPLDLSLIVENLDKSCQEVATLTQLVDQTLRHNDELKKEAAEAIQKSNAATNKGSAEGIEPAHGLPAEEEEPVEGKFAGLTKILVDKEGEDGPKFSGDFDF